MLSIALLLKASHTGITILNLVKVQILAERGRDASQLNARNDLGRTISPTKPCQSTVLILSLALSFSIYVYYKLYYILYILYLSMYL